MPRYDKTGPAGQGPMTGRGQGVCNSEENLEEQSLCVQEGICRCPTCDYEKPHEPGVPCQTEMCPTCGKSLVRFGPTPILSSLKKLAENLLK